METKITTTIERKDVNMSATALHQLTLDTIEQCIDYAKLKNWVITDKSDSTPAEQSERMRIGLQNASKNQRKRIGVAIFRIQKKPTMRKINLFFHHIKKLSGGTIDISFAPSLAEQKSLALRKQYLAAKAEMERIYAEYTKAKKEAYGKQ